MGIFSFIICLICFIFFLLNAKNRPLHPAALFFGIYSGILFLSLLNLYGIYKPSDEAYAAILLMLIFFAVGSLTSFLPYVKVSFGRKKAHMVTYHLNMNIFYVLVGIAILFLLYDVAMVIKYYFDGVPLWQIRNWTLEAYGSDNPILSRRTFLEELFRTVVLYPVGMIIPPIASYSFFASEYAGSRKWMLFLAIIHVLLTCIAGGGGRLKIVYFGGCIILAYLLFSNKRSAVNLNKRKYKKYVMIFLIIAFLGVFIATNMRTGTGYFIEQGYTYFAIPPTLLSIWLPKIEDAVHTHGLLSFYGLFGYVFRAFKMLGFKDLVPAVYDEAYQHLLNAQLFRNIGPRVANAFVTPVYYMMIDGGKPFLCAGSAFFGILVQRVHKRLIKCMDIRAFCIYALVMYGVFISFMSVLTNSPPLVISFIFIFIVCSKK